MGDKNQLLFVRRHAERLAGPYLEVGSKDYGNTQDLRPLFAGRGQYVGADMESGPKVDVVLDFTAGFDALDRALGGRRFGTIFCLSVLEHCAQPFLMAENLTRLLLPGGQICVSVPFAFCFHGYPSDYWRFTHEVVKLLFPRLDFDLADGVEAGWQDNDFRPLGKRIGRIDFGTKSHWREGRPLRGLSAKLLGVLGAAGILRWLSGGKHVLRPTNLMMVGRLPEDGHGWQ